MLSVPSATLRGWTAAPPPQQRGPRRILCSQLRRGALPLPTHPRPLPCPALPPLPPPDPPPLRRWCCCGRRRGAATPPPKSAPSSSAPSWRGWRGASRPWLARIRPPASSRPASSTARPQVQSGLVWSGGPARFGYAGCLHPAHACTLAGRSAHTGSSSPATRACLRVELPSQVVHVWWGCPCRFCCCCRARRDPQGAAAQAAGAQQEPLRALCGQPAHRAVAQAAAARCGAVW